MSTISLNSPEGAKWAKEVIRHYGSWSAVRAASERTPDGVAWMVPWPPNDDCYDARTKAKVRAAA